MIINISNVTHAAGTVDCHYKDISQASSKDFMSVENFSKILDKVGASSFVETVGLSGGEPLLHPDFEEILRVCADCHVTFATKFVIETDAVLLKEVIDKIPDFMHVVINVRTIEELGEQYYRQMIESLDYVTSEYKWKFTNGSNRSIVFRKTISPYTKFDDVIFTYLKKVRAKGMILSISSVPMGEDKRDRTLFYPKAWESAKEYINRAVDDDIIISTECFHIPGCFSEGRELILMKITSQITLDSYDICHKMCMVDYDAMVTICLWANQSQKFKKPIDEFETMDQAEIYAKRLHSKIKQNNFCVKCMTEGACLLKPFDMCHGGCICFDDVVEEHRFSEL